MTYYAKAQLDTPPQKSAITLDYIREKTDKEYAPYVIDMGTGILTLRSPLRLHREKRRVVQGLVARLQEINTQITELDEDESPPEGVEEELQQVMLGVIEASADNQELAFQLLAELEDDLGMTQILFYDWFGAEEVGEASDSPS